MTTLKHLIKLAHHFAQLVLRYIRLSFCPLFGLLLFLVHGAPPLANKKGHQSSV
jgi:hypothetical protein